MGDNRERRPFPRDGVSWGIGVGLGVLVGVLLAVVMASILTGLAIGVGLGLAFAVAIGVGRADALERRRRMTPATLDRTSGPRHPSVRP